MVRIARHRAFRRVRRGIIVPKPEAEEPHTRLGRIGRFFKRLVIGAPLATAQEQEERTSKIKGLAIFASDNISSSAYATEEMMRVLVLAGAAALALTMPITIAILVVLAIVITSYLQVIRAHPEGGGSYIVALHDLGPVAGLTAAAALTTDYVLTVAVSTSAGVAAITSAFPGLFEHRVLISVGVVALMAILNLRGIRESGNVFAAPTYLYVVAMLGLLALGFYLALTGHLPHYEPTSPLPEGHGVEVLTLLLVLRAFSSGSVALTGTEAIADGVPAFKRPEVRNAQITLVAMGVLFAIVFVGVGFLAGQIGIIPDPTEQETVNSQLTRALVGNSWYYYLVQMATAVLLVLAANTAFNGFPRLANIMARDRFIPRSFGFRGDRLAYTAGILALAFVAMILIVIFQGSVTLLIPLYTVGVFLAFTLSQAGLVKRWHRLRAEEPGWRWRAAVNGLGALVTGVVTVVVAVSKFLLGAWIVLLLLPILVFIMRAIRQHYDQLDTATRPETPLVPEEVHARAIVPIANAGVTAKQALAFAAALVGRDRVVAVHVADDEEAADKFQQEWEEHRPEIPLVIMESPFRSLIGPLLAYIDAVRESEPSDTLMVVLPEFVPRHWWEHFLHNQTALRLKANLFFRPGVVVVSVPYHLGRKTREQE